MSNQQSSNQEESSETKFDSNFVFFYPEKGGGNIKIKEGRKTSKEIIEGETSGGKVKKI